MRDIPKPLFVAFGVYAVISGTIMSVLILVVGVMFVVMGNTPGRLIGAVLLGVLLIPWVGAIRATGRRYRKAASGRE